MLSLVLRASEQLNAKIKKKKKIQLELLGLLFEFSGI